MKPKSFWQLHCLLSILFFSVHFSIYSQFYIPENNGSFSNPFSVEEAISRQDQDGKYWVRGYIVGCVKTGSGIISDSYVKTNLALSSDPLGTIHLAVQLMDNAVRDQLNLVDNPGNRGKRVLVYGILKKYNGIAGLRNSSFCEFVTGPQIVVSPSPLIFKEYDPATIRVKGIGLDDSIRISTVNNEWLRINPKLLLAGISDMSVSVGMTYPGSGYLLFRSDTVFEKVNIYCKPRSNNAMLDKLSVGNELIKLNDAAEYEAKPVPFNVRTVTISAIPADEKAAILDGTGDVDLEIGENQVNIRVQAENEAIRTYRIRITRLCSPPEIVRQPVSVSVCEGKEYVLDVKTSGDSLRYRWFFENDSMPGETGRVLRISDPDPEKNYGYYRLEVTGACGQSESRPIRVWVAKMLPEILILDAPDEALAGSSHKVRIGNDFGYNDVTGYQWSFSGNAHFYSSTGEDSPVVFVTFGKQPGFGTLKTELFHVCGKRSVSKRIKILRGSPITGLDIQKQLQPEVYPNPVEDILMIDCKNLPVQAVIISGISGQVIENIERPEVDSFFPLKIPVGHLKRGMYVISIISGDEIFRYKLRKK